MDYSTDYYSSSSSLSSSEAAGLAVGMGIFFVFMLIFVIAAYVINAFLLSRIFKKAGVEQWIAWVPVYNSWKLLEIGGQPGWWAILAFVPFVNIAAVIFMYIAMYHIGLKLQKEGWFVLLAIFVPIVWIIWLAFDDSKWQEEGQTVTTGAAPAPVTPKPDVTDSEPSNTVEK